MLCLAAALYAGPDPPAAVSRPAVPPATRCRVSTLLAGVPRRLAPLFEGTGSPAAIFGLSRHLARVVSRCCTPCLPTAPRAVGQPGQSPMDAPTKHSVPSSRARTHTRHLASPSWSPQVFCHFVARPAAVAPQDEGKDRPTFHSINRRSTRRSTGWRFCGVGGCTEAKGCYQQMVGKRAISVVVHAPATVTSAQDSLRRRECISSFSLGCRERISSAPLGAFGNRLQRSALHAPMVLRTLQCVS